MQLLTEELKYQITVTIDVTDADREFLETDPDLRIKLNEASKKRKMDTTDELAATKEALQRMTDEMKKLREDMDNLRKENEAHSTLTAEDFALGYSATNFLAMNPTKSLQWVSSSVVPRLKLEIENHKAGGVTPPLGELSFYLF
jgi:hypothetical protein